MKRLLILFIVLIPLVVWAGNITQPPVIQDKVTREYLKTIADNLHKFEITTTAPNGSRRGDKGEAILYNNAGTFQLWINTDGNTAWQQI